MAKSIPIVINGQTFCSVREACKQLGLARSTVRKRRSKGANLQEALRPVNEDYNALAIQVNGTHFRSKKAAAEHFNVPYPKFLDRMDLGWSLEEALEIAPRPAPQVGYRERICAFSDAHNSSISSMENRLAVRRKRFRKWLEVPVMDNQGHVNADHRVDESGEYYYSLKQASKALHCRVTTAKRRTRHTDDDPVFGQRYPFDSEMELSVESLLILLCSKSVVSRVLRTPESKQRLRLDQYVTVEVAIQANLDQYEIALRIKKLPLLQILQSNERIERIIYLAPSQSTSEAWLRLLRGMGCTGSVQDKIEEIHQYATRFSCPVCLG